MALPLLPITIVETSGKFRPVILAGSNLPREKLETTLGVVQRTKVTRYTGNAMANGQVLGVDWPPIQFGGLLEDRRMGVPGGAVLIAKLIEQVAKSGRECLFNYGPYFRRVLWKKATFKTIELARIEYRIELEVLDDGLGLRRRVKGGTRAVPDPVNAIAAQNEALIDLNVLPNAVGTVAAVAARLAITESTDLTVRAGDRLDFVGEPGQLVDSSSARTSLGFLDEAKVKMSEGQTEARLLSWDAIPAQNDFDSLMDTGRLIMEARSSIRTAIEALITLREQVSVLAGEARFGQVYLTASGDTLQAISNRFYGTPDRWHEIYSQNGLGSPSLAGGEQLLLKDVPEGDPQVVL